MDTRNVMMMATLAAWSGCLADSGAPGRSRPPRAISLLISSRQAEAMTWISAYRVKRHPNPPSP